MAYTIFVAGVGIFSWQAGVLLVGAPYVMQLIVWLSSVELVSHGPIRTPPYGRIPCYQFPNDTIQTEGDFLSDYFGPLLTQGSIAFNTVSDYTTGKLWNSQLDNLLNSERLQNKYAERLMRTISPAAEQQKVQGALTTIMGLEYEIPETEFSGYTQRHLPDYPAYTDMLLLYGLLKKLDRSASSSNEGPLTKYQPYSYLLAALVSRLAENGISDPINEVLRPLETGSYRNLQPCGNTGQDIYYPPNDLK